MAKCYYQMKGARLRLRPMVLLACLPVKVECQWYKRSPCARVSTSWSVYSFSCLTLCPSFLLPFSSFFDLSFLQLPFLIGHYSLAKHFIPPSFPLPFKSFVKYYRHFPILFFSYKDTISPPFFLSLSIFSITHLCLSFSHDDNLFLSPSPPYLSNFTLYFFLFLFPQQQRPQQLNNFQQHSNTTTQWVPHSSQHN